MKKRVISVLLLLTLTLFCSCSETETYIQVANDAPHIPSYFFESLLEQSDIIAEIEIIENLGETNDPYPETYFKANIVTIIKGDETLESLNFKQGVTSAYTYEGYTVFEVGQRLVLFLAKVVGEEYSEDMYWIRGDYLSVIRIDTVGDKEYANKLFGTFKDFPFENEENAFKSLRYKRERLIEEIANRMD